MNNTKRLNIFQKIKKEELVVVLNQHKELKKENHIKKEKNMKEINW